MFTPYLLYLKIGLGISLIIAAGIFYYNWKESVKLEAILQFKIAQQEAIIESQKKEAEFLKAQVDLANRLQEEKQKIIEDLQKELDNAEQDVHTNNEDGESPKILKDAVEALSKLRKK
jgi:hypothetical protein